MAREGNDLRDGLPSSQADATDFRWRPPGRAKRRGAGTLGHRTDRKKGEGKT